MSDRTKFNWMIFQCALGSACLVACTVSIALGHVSTSMTNLAFGIANSLMAYDKIMYFYDKYDF